jgi:AcrR family transcriptional regulator
MMGRPRSFDQATTLDAIRDRFWETGYAATSIDDLMAATGLSKGSLYGAFGSKHAMYVRVLEDYSAAGLAGLRERLAGDDAGALRRLKAYLRNYAKMAAQMCTQGCMMAKATAELAGRDPDVDAIVARFLADMEAAFTASIKQAQRAGDVPRTVDARQAALTLIAVHRGVESIGKMGASAATLRSIVERALEALTN